MLLETLDLRTNDVLIYSENKFDFENNFTIIYKNEKIKRRRNISYFDVCDFIKSPSPKNLIVYRLLTNVRDLESNSAKYGYFIQMEDHLELVYFDPVFAIKDLTNFRFTIDPDKFRFKIQQVGLTSFINSNSEVCYKETYHFDLHAAEAQTQNDKIFADAIFALDDSFEENIAQKEEEPESDLDPITLAFEKYHAQSEKVRIDNITEDSSVSGSNINPMKLAGDDSAENLRDKAIETLKEALGVKEEKNIKNNNAENAAASLRAVIEGQNTDKDDDIKINVDVDSLFKSAKKQGLSGREDDDIVLRFK